MKKLMAILFTILSILTLTAQAEDFQIDQAPMRLSFMKRDLSGIAFNKTSGTFFYIENGKQQIFEADKSHTQIGDTIKLKDCGDTEEIVYLGSREIAGRLYPEVAVANEGGEIFIFTITNQRKYSRKDMLVFNINKNKRKWGNKGIEGLAYDGKNQIFYAAKEMSPMKLFRFKRPADRNEAMNLDVEVIADNRSLSQMDPNNIPVKDISALFFNELTNRLMILSHENHKLFEIELRTFTTVNTFALPRFSNIFRLRKSQFEGVTMDGNGSIIAVSEPYYLLRF